ncbi:hypothetical protein ACHAWF_004886, partial [Thalassiosira exigua]
MEPSAAAPFPGGNEAADNRSGDDVPKKAARQSADVGRDSFDERIRRKADSGGKPAVPPAGAATESFEARLRRKADSGGTPAWSTADAVRESFEERVRRKADSEGKPAPPADAEAEAARTRFEARLRRKGKADSGGKPALPPADAAREGFEARLRRKADAGAVGRPATQPMSSPAAAAPAAKSDSSDHGAATNCDGIADEAKESFDQEGHRNLIEEWEGNFTNTITFPTDTETATCQANEGRVENPSAGDDIVNLGEWKERFHKALNDLHHMEQEHGEQLSLPASDPRVVKVIQKLSFLDVHMRSSVRENSLGSMQFDAREDSPLLGDDEQINPENSTAKEDDEVSVKGNASTEGEGLHVHSSSSLPPGAASRDEEGSTILLDDDADGNGPQPGTISDEITRSSHNHMGSALVSWDSPETCRQTEEVDQGTTRNQPRRSGGQWRSITSSAAAARSFSHGASVLRRLASSVYVVRATLVEEDRPDVDDAEVVGEVYMAEHVGFWDHRKAKRLACVMCALVSLLIVSLSFILTGVIDVGGPSVEDDARPPAQPSSSPTFDPRPTLEVVQERGFVRCGLDGVTMEIGGMKEDLCRSVAAVVVGNPDNFEKVEVTGSSRWNVLQNRDIDVLIYADTHTVVREVRESSSGFGFAFSSPYNYDGLIYSGNSTFVKCAEEHKRYKECSSISICVYKASTHYELLRMSFPSEYFKLVSSYAEMLDMLLNDTCNVVAEDKGFLHGGLPDIFVARDRGFVEGGKMMTKEPLAMVTRNTDMEWSDAVNWVLQALIYGEEQGLTRDSSRCQIGANLDLQSASDLDFMNAVHCVGNYAEQHDRKKRGMNQINNGTGMVFAIPFGNLDQDEITDLPSDSMLAKVMNKGSFNCGVVVPDGFAGNVMESDGLVGMSVDYCRTLSAALFTGDSNNINFITLQETKDSPYADLANGTIDVLVGGKLQRKYDFGLPPLFRGLQYSTSYYFGDEAATDDVSFYSMATRQEDVLFDSFVNMVVLATIFADENGITKEESRRMPLVSIFGPKLYWSLRDAISYSGSYDKLYRKHFGSVFQSGYIEQFSEE